MFRVPAAALAAIVMTAAVPSTASAGCFGLLCGAAVQTCGNCYQQQQYVYQPQYVPPQYQAVQETVMVAPPRVVARRVPAQYQTVMVPKTVMVAPPSVEYDRIPAQYGVRERVQMVAPAQTYYRAVPAYSGYGYGYGYSGGCRSNCGW
jgi:hypothetical protein